MCWIVMMISLLQQFSLPNFCSIWCQPATFCTLISLFVCLSDVTANSSRGGTHTAIPPASPGRRSWKIHTKHRLQWFQSGPKKGKSGKKFKTDFDVCIQWFLWLFPNSCVAVEGKNTVRWLFSHIIYQFQYLIVLSNVTCVMQGLGT